MRLKKLIAIALMAAMTMTLAVPVVFAQGGEEGDLEEQLGDVEQMAAEAEAEKQEILDSIDYYQNRLKDLEGEVANTQEAIDAKNNEIDELTEDIKEAKQRVSDREEGLGNRIRTMYKNGSVSWLEIILESQNFSELLSNIDMLQRIYESDQETLERFEEEHESLEQILVELEAVEKELQAAKEELVEEQVVAQETEEALAVEVERIEEKIQEFEVQAANLRAYIVEEQARMEAELARIRAEQEAAERAAQEEAERAAREEAERIAREEAERRAQEEAERAAQEEAERLAREENERRAAEALAALEAERQAQAEAAAEEGAEEGEEGAEGEEGETAELPEITEADIQYEEVTAEDYIEEARQNVNVEDYYEEPEVEYYDGYTYVSAGTGSEGFVWPTSGPITYWFGAREAPVYGASTNHGGIDIGVDEGTPIVASRSGIVMISDWYYGYGIAVVIAHGDGISTIYGHNSATCVSVGEYVEQGQLVAYSGNTGISSGPHCHFEIVVNGVSVDPMGYL